MMMQATRPILLLAIVAMLSGCASEKTPTQQTVPQDTPAESPEDLVQDLAEAYRTRDWELFKSLLADGVNAPEYLFILDPAAASNDEQWGYTVEARIHQRMFEPENTLEGQAPVPAEYWLTSISITLTRSSMQFTERGDLYQSAANPTGLDPTRWKAVDAIYATDVLFDTQGDLDFQVTDRANFVVIEDLDKTLGESGKFLILQWNDLGASLKGSAGSERTWGEFKSLYR